ncbi:hypothetical protein HNP52_001524 [Sphingomonas kyeonggiensis]|uniref:DUF6265 domain-containing protein n=1 Tax=Sphingomonas kyeonggiensis TaxID=1268553 RepID=A0A7W7NR33_9SPHN|nr:DUF6265 family protein [Sphingomonas kyeonggiensis]MBB4838473.1 hypothetical protein [Sphingomonas kyeonggiensis]
MIANLMLLAGIGLSPESFDWLVGKWCTEPRNGRMTCETWQPGDADGVLHGETVITSPKGEQRETMRIGGTGDALVFHAEPAGQAPADFKVKPGGIGAQSVEFLDTAHDYPQRVRYWREGEMLMAEISLADGSKPMRWAYRRVTK